MAIQSVSIIYHNQRITILQTTIEDLRLQIASLKEARLTLQTQLSKQMGVNECLRERLAESERRLSCEAGGACDVADVVKM